MTLPILILILFACYEFSQINMVMHATESAAYEAARTAIVPGTTQAEIDASARGVLSSVGIRDFALTVTPALPAQDSQTVRVEIAVPFRKNSTVFRLFIADPVLRGRCELLRESF